VRPGSMSLRLELFVVDMDRAIRFYRDVLGFALLGRERDYASLGHGEVVFGLWPVAKLPAAGGYFTRSRLSQDRGLGVEIVLEVDDIGAAYDGVRASGHLILEPLRNRPWGLTDFRLSDPDGYYLRITSRGRSGGDPDLEGRSR
jgi:lactoylglutathione lyase